MANLISLSLGNVATLLAAAAFLVGGAVNACAAKSIREEFVRYGFPWWWCWATAALEMMTTILLVLRPIFTIGVILGASMMLAAIIAVVCARDFRHIPPPAVFLLLLATAATFQFSS
jgi:hypothetical protein